MSTRNLNALRPAMNTTGIWSRYARLEVGIPRDIDHLDVQSKAFAVRLEFGLGDIAQMAVAARVDDHLDAHATAAKASRVRYSG